MFLRLHTSSLGDTFATIRFAVQDVNDCATEKNPPAVLDMKQRWCKKMASSASLAQLAPTDKILADVPKRYIKAGKMKRY